MIEKIISIDEATNIKEKETDYWGNDGFLIVTNKQIIKLMISNGQSCCESWGYFMSEDKFDNYIGADLFEISVTDTALATIKFEQYLGPEDMDSGGMMFVNISTSKGLLQFVAYNSHNGYYGHTAYVVSDQLKVEEDL